MGMTKDQRLAAALFLLSTGYFFQALRIPAYPFPVPVDADVFPKALGLVLALLSALLWWQGRAVTPAGETETHDDKGETGRFLASARGRLSVILGACLLYALLLETIGFVLVTAAFLFGITWFLGYRRHLVSAAVAVGFSVGMFFIFTGVLKMNLPLGVLEWIR